jgi:hypothetical protein
LALRLFYFSNDFGRFNTPKDSMPGSLDIVVRLRAELPACKVPVSAVASLAGISGSKLVSYINGVQNCPAQQYLRLNDAWRDLKNLIEAVRPLILDYRKVEMLRTCIKLQHEGRLHVAIFDPTAIQE